MDQVSWISSEWIYSTNAVEVEEAMGEEMVEVAEEEEEEEEVVVVAEEVRRRRWMGFLKLLPTLREKLRTHANFNKSQQTIYQKKA